MICFFRINGLADDECEGRYDRCHLIPQQRIKQAFRHLPTNELQDILTDPRNLIVGCRKHHYRFDYARTIRLSEDDHPEPVFDFARDHDFEFFGPDRGWLHVKEAE